jgi:hypothetical protein
MKSEILEGHRHTLPLKASKTLKEPKVDQEREICVMEMEIGFLFPIQIQSHIHIRTSHLIPRR